jgi:hydroxymethylbilane synthase
MNLRIGSRGSQLALWQANHIATLLRGQGHEVEIEIIKTSGDRLQEVTFAQAGAMAGSKGIFTKEIEEALADGRIDLAVHSLKDLPTELPELFTLAATPERVDPRDAFVSVKYANLAALPGGARVGTSSLRRRAQLKAIRPDVEAVEFRGNVDTRLRKLAEGQVEAVLLAAAGLDRLNKTEWLRERLDVKNFCPAPGQGALGIETRKDDAVTMAAVAFLDDAATRFTVTAERAALAALGGGCQVPIGIHCRAAREPGPETNQESKPESIPGLAAGREKGSQYEIFAVVAEPETGTAVRVYHCASFSGPEALGRLAAKMLLDAGAGSIIEAQCGGLR